MNKLTFFSIAIVAFIFSFAFSPAKTEAASTSVYIAPYGTVYVTANHYGNRGQWDAQGTNNLMSNPSGAAMAAINSGGSYSYTYSCGNRDVVSASCAGGRSCYQGDVYNVSGSCGLTKVEECNNGCTNGSCNLPIPGSPDTPTNLVAQTSDLCGTKIRLTWSNANLATSYKIYRSQSASGTFTEVANSPTTSTDFTDTPGVGTYYYKIKAHNNIGDSLFSSVVSAASSAYCPPIGTTGGVSVATGNNAPSCGGKVTLAWAPVSGAAGYNVYRWTTDYSTSYNSYHANYVSYSRANNNFPYYFNYYGYNTGLLTPNGTTTTGFTDKPGQGTFYYTVSAFPSAGANKSDVGLLAQPAIQAVASPRCPPPPTPTNLRAQTSLSCGGKARLTWDKSTGADAYYLLRSTSANGSYSEVGPLSGDAVYYTDTPGVGTYYYKILAEAGGERSAPSSAVTVTTSGVCPPNAPISITFKANPSFVARGKTCNLEWVVSNSDSCKIVGSNGDEKSFNPNEQEKYTTSALQSRTIYTLTCTNGDETISKTAACSINPSQSEI